MPGVRQFFRLLVPVLALVVSSPLSAFASGYRITNQSLEAVGLAGAHVAFTPGPDSSYYNPAGMTELADQWQVETSLTFLDLPTIDYRDDRSPVLDGSSENELYVMPLVHVVSPEYGRLRYGFSLTYPFGLAKQWEQAFPRATAEQFSLLVVEANPTLAFKPAQWLSLGGGVRLLYGRGEVDSQVTNPPFTQLAPLTDLSRSSEGTDTTLGYNLALTVRPWDNWSFAATYRSENTLDLAGTSDLHAWAGNWALASYTGDGRIEVSLPAVFTVAAAHTFGDVTLELVWDRTFWSSFDQLDFRYNQSFTGTLFDGFDRSVIKKWTDSDAYRLGVTYRWNTAWTSTLGLAYDKTPVPSETLGFELPDSDAFVYCAGVRYRYSESLETGISYMYHQTESRSVAQESATGLPGINGTFTEGGAHAVTIGVIASF